MVFVDTSFWIGLTTPRDSRHDECRELFGAYRTESLVTSNLVRGETWTLLNRRFGYSLAVEFLDGAARTGRLRVVVVSEELERRAWLWLRRHDERPYSFVDATSFAVMESLRIREALAFDADFSAAGFAELRA